MAYIIPNVSETGILNSLVASENMLLKLYSAPTTAPSVTDLANTYTEVSSTNVPGYVARILYSALWVISGNQPATAVYPQQVFNVTGATSVNIVGYYIIGQSSGTLYLVEQFPSPYSFAAGGSVLIAPTLTLK
jgi:hypothetical protein